MKTTVCLYWKSKFCVGSVLNLTNKAFWLWKFRYYLLILYMFFYSDRQGALFEGWHFLWLPVVWHLQARWPSPLWRSAVRKWSLSSTALFVTGYQRHFRSGNFAKSSCVVLSYIDDVCPTTSFSSQGCAMPLRQRHTERLDSAARAYMTESNRGHNMELFSN